MADIAVLGLEIKTLGAEQASASLDKVSASSHRAEIDAKKFAAALKQTGGDVRKIKPEMLGLATATKTMGDGATSSARKIVAANDNISRSTRAMSGVFALAKRNVIAFGVAAAASIVAAFSVRPVFEFKDALAEVSTLVNTATFDMRGLEKAAHDQARAFGGGSTAQVKAFYQIISAGATTAAQATETLTAANKLAIGGVTDVMTAADGLTSVMNAYGDKVESATSVSDAMFVGMAKGKTTIGELSGALGRVAPFAAQVGMSFDELVASVAALTKGGISTREAMTGVRAVLQGVSKPAAEATKLAEQLGIDFNLAGLKAMGFAGFLDHVMEKTGGSSEALTTLFGAVEAIVPVLAFAGEAGVTFTDIMEQMSVKAGATEEAFNKMVNSPGFQAGRLWSALQVEVFKLGNTLATVLVPVMRVLADNMENIFRLAKIVGAGMIVAFGPTILAMVQSLVVAVGVGLVGAFNALTAAMLRNPLGAFAVAVTVAITALWQFRDEARQVFGVDLIGYVLLAGNAIINSFQAAFTDVVFIWRNLPDVIGALVVGAANATIKAVENMLTRAVDMINTFVEGVNSALATVSDIQIGTVGKVDLGRIENEGADALMGGGRHSALSRHNEEIARLMSRDIFGAFDTAAEEATATTEKLGGALEKVKIKLKEVDEEAEKLAKSYAKIVEGAKLFIAEQKLEASVIGMAEEAAQRLRFEFDLLNQARAAGIKLTAEQRAELAGLASAMAAAEARTNALKDAYESVQQAIADTIDFAKDLTKGFITDLRSGLEQGKSLWRSFADAAINALNKIADKLLDVGIDMLFSGMTSGGTGAAAGGGGIFAGIASLFGFSRGGAVSGPGNGRIDTVPAMLANGEFVINAEQARKFRPLLEAVNDNSIQGFTHGGGVAGSGIGGIGAANPGTPGMGGTSTGGSTGVGSSHGGTSGGVAAGGQAGTGVGGVGQAGPGTQGMGGTSTGGSAGIGGGGGGFGAGMGSPGGTSGGAQSAAGMGANSGIGGGGGGVGTGASGGGFSGGFGAANPGLGIGTSGFAGAAVSNAGMFGFGGSPTATNPNAGFFGGIVAAIQGFPNNVFGRTDENDQGRSTFGKGFHSNKDQSRIGPSFGQTGLAFGLSTTSVNTSIADQVAQAIGFSAALSNAMTAVANTPHLGITANFGALLGDTMTAIGNRIGFQNEMAQALADFQGRSPAKDQSRIGLSFPGDANRTDSASNVVGFAQAQDPGPRGQPAPGLPAFGSPSAPSSPDATSPFAGWDSTIDKLVKGWAELSDFFAGQKARFGFQVGRIGGVGGGRDQWEDLLATRGMSDGGFAGFYAGGGRIPAGRWGIAGENGPEPISGPATVLPNSALGGGGTNVINIRGGDVIVQGNADEKTLPLIRQEIENNNARQQRELAQTFGQYQGRWSTFKQAS